MKINAERSWCLSETEMLMNGTEFEPFVHRYLFPLVSIFGIIGNCLNLCVLLSMKTRLNTFLWLLAFADIIFLVLLWPNILANVPIFTFNHTFRYFYYATRVHILAVANWSSAVATWCVIVVCAERLKGILRPLTVRTPWPRWKMLLIIADIVMGPFILTIYQHFDYACRTVQYCNRTQILQRCLRVSDERWFANGTNMLRPENRSFMHFSMHLYVGSMILLPIVLLLVLNLLLIFALRRRRHNIMHVEVRESSPALASRADSIISERYSPIPFMIKVEQRVKITILLIVTTFTLTNGPSAVLQLARTTFGLQGKRYYDLMIISKSVNIFFKSFSFLTNILSIVALLSKYNNIFGVLVICGKASNFILFCLGSRHFRRRLLLTLSRNPLVKRIAKRNSFDRWLKQEDPRDGKRPSLRPSILSFL